MKHKRIFSCFMALVVIASCFALCCGSATALTAEEIVVDMDTLSFTSGTREAVSLAGLSGYGYSENEMHGTVKFAFGQHPYMSTSFEFTVTTSGHYWVNYFLNCEVAYKGYIQITDSSGTVVGYVGTTEPSGGTTGVYTCNNTNYDIVFETGETYKFTAVLACSSELGNMSVGDYLATQYRMSWDMEYYWAMDGTAPGTNPDIVESGSYLTLDKIDADGKLWYLYHGYGDTLVDYQKLSNDQWSVTESNGQLSFLFFSGSFSETAHAAGNTRLYNSISLSNLIVPVSGNYQAKSVVTGDVVFRANSNLHGYCSVWAASGSGYSGRFSTPAPYSLINDQGTNVACLAGSPIVNTYTRLNTQFFIGTIANINYRLYFVCEPINFADIGDTYNISVGDT